MKAWMRLWPEKWFAVADYSASVSIRRKNVLVVADCWDSFKTRWKIVPTLGDAEAWLKQNAVPCKRIPSGKRRGYSPIVKLAWDTPDTVVQAHDVRLLPRRAWVIVYKGGAVLHDTQRNLLEEYATYDAAVVAHELRGDSDVDV